MTTTTASRPDVDRRLADPRYLSPVARRNRAFVLLVLTLLLPGSAQAAAGGSRLGRVALRAWLAVVGLVVLGVVGFLLDRSLVINVMSSSWVLLLLTGALVVAALLWPLLFLDAWRQGRPRLQSQGVRRATAGVTVGLVVLTSVPLLWAARQVDTGRELLATAFGGNKHSAAAGGRYNVLLMGGDAGADRIGVRPDSITLLSIDVDTGKPVMFSFPRNMQNIPFPDSSPMHTALPHGFDCGDDCLLNAVYTYATDHKGLYPASVKDPGAQATMDAVSAISGLKINYYVMMDLQGFQDLVDAVGGVTIDVKQPLPIGNGGTLKTGVHTLNGYHALWYARSRHADSDYARMARQRCVMTAMLAQLDPATVLLRFQQVAKASAGLVKTSIPQGDLGTFVDLSLKARSQPLTSVQFVPPLTVPSHPDFAAVRAKVASTIKASEGTSTTSATKGSSKPSTSTPRTKAAKARSARQTAAVCSAA
ncbi:hypothetical protein GCM10027446_05610 [Angustibacter peucedani]